MLGVLAGFAVIVVASCAVGGAGMLLVRAPWSWTAPAVGLALLVVICGVAISLPGGATTSAVVLAGLTVASLAVLWRARPPVPRAGEAAAAGLIALAVGMVPFLVSWRVGLLGMSANDDSARHLLVAEFLRADGEAPDWVLGAGYPLGPHALIATVAHLTGARGDLVLDGLLLAVLVLTAVTALAAFDGLRGWRAVAGAALVALAYLPAAYFAQAAFKETLMALWVLAFAVQLRVAAREHSSAAAIPLAVIAAATVYAYSFFGLAWPAAIVGCFAVVSFATARRDALAGVLRAARAVVPALVVLVALTAPTLAAAADLFGWVGLSPAGGAIPRAEAGYTVAQLSPLEALGVWPSGDWRVAPQRTAVTVVAALVAVAAVAYAAVWWARRRDYALLAAVAAGVIAYLVLRPTQSAYVSAKALAIVSPLIVLLCVRALLEPVAGRGRALLAAAFTVGALGSTLLALRTAQVGTDSHRAELAALTSTLHGRPVLYLANDEYASWRLFGVNFIQPGGAVPIRPEKAFQQGHALDFDAVDASALDGVDYVIGTRAAYASAPPENFRLVRRTPSYALWQRTGATAPRAILGEGAAPGAVLDCATEPGRAVAEAEGRAVVTPAPVSVPLPPTVSAGGAATVSLPLTPGRWELSLQYRSPRSLRVRGPALDAEVPASLDQLGPLWPGGTMTVPGAPGAPAQPVSVTVAMDDEALPGLRHRTALLGTIGATPVGSPPRRVPLRRACGAYVDSFGP